MDLTGYKILPQGKGLVVDGNTNSTTFHNQFPKDLIEKLRACEGGENLDTSQSVKLTQGSWQDNGGFIMVFGSVVEYKLVKLSLCTLRR